MATELALSDVLPLLETILKQQMVISERLKSLIETLKFEPEPVEPTLRALLRPMHNGISDMKEVLSVKGSTGASTTSLATGSSAPPTA